MSDTKDVFEKSLSIARQVLPFMGSNSIPATPDNYIIFYFYHQGESDLVKKTVDEQLNSGLEWDDATTKRMFEQLFGSEVNLDLFKMNERMATEIKDMAQDIIEETRATAEKAGQTSQKLEESLSETEGFENIGDATDWLKSTFEEINSVKGMYDNLTGTLKNKASKLDGIVDSLARLEQVALTDELTSLANRRAWNQRLDNEFKRYQRYKTGFSMAILDIDNFKNFNDTYGHLIGDKALQEVARVVTANIRDVDFAARFGGEEFTILLPETGLKGAAEVAERVRSALARTEFMVKGVAVPVTASFGVAQLNDQDNSSDDLLERADKALYLAKERGKNRVCIETQL